LPAFRPTPLRARWGGQQPPPQKKQPTDRREHGRPTVGTEPSAANGHGPCAVAVAIDPAHSATVFAAVEALDPPDQIERFRLRVAAERGRWVQGSNEGGDSGTRLAERSFQVGRKVQDVGDRDDRRLGFPVEKAAVRQQRFVDHVDDHSMLDLVLDARQKPLGGCRVGVGIAAARGCSCEGSASDGAVVDLDQQFRRCADQPVDRVTVAAAEAGLQTTENRVDVDRVIGPDAYLAGNDGLAQRAVADGVAGGGDRCEVLRDRRQRADAERRGTGPGVRGGGKQRLSVVVDSGHPLASRSILADEHLRHNQ
jgi:hypothetical protein